MNERLTAIEAAAAARGAERARSAAKGADFEDLLESMLADVARGAGDLLDRTGTEAGGVLRSKKGDFVLTIDPARTGGADVRVVIEAKDRAMSGRAIREELREAKENRAAAVGVVVFGPDHAPAGIAPFDVRAGDVYCVDRPGDPDPATLDAAIRLGPAPSRSPDSGTLPRRSTARRSATHSQRSARELDAIKGIKATLTSIAKGPTGVQSALERAPRGDPRPDRRGRGGDQAAAGGLIAAPARWPASVVRSGAVRCGPDQ